MIVAVSMRIVEAPNYKERRDAISNDLIAYLAVQGLTPVPVPNCLDDPGAFLRAINAERICLSGGNGLEDNAIAGRAPSTAETRDHTEFRMMDYARGQGLPVLGICRGLQAINAYFGGAATRDIGPVVSENHVAHDHTVRFRDGTEFTVNSFHDDGVLGDQVSPELTVVASSPGGIVEALEHPSLPITAMQWHPERPCEKAATLNAEFVGSWIKCRP